MATITIVTAGSRGDVQPYLALSVGLLRAGHQVRLATHDDYRAWIESYGVEHHHLEGDPKAMVEQGQLQEWLETGRRGIGFAEAAPSSGGRPGRAQRRQAPAQGLQADLG
jgi:sterol 3beta-glucosyltransferase